MAFCVPLLQAAAAEADVRDARMQAELREIGQVSPLLFQDLFVEFCRCWDCIPLGIAGA